MKFDKKFNQLHFYGQIKGIILKKSIKENNVLYYKNFSNLYLTVNCLNKKSKTLMK